MMSDQQILELAKAPISCRDLSKKSGVSIVELVCLMTRLIAEGKAHLCFQIGGTVSYRDFKDVPRDTLMEEVVPVYCRTMMREAVTLV